MTPPSVHVRAALTWVAIFPLVALTSAALRPITADLPALAGTAVMTAVVVPLAVYVVMPALLRAHAAVQRRRAATRGLS